MNGITRRGILQLGFLALAAGAGGAAKAQPSGAGGDWRKALVDAARSQIGVTTLYDPAYRRIAYPGGDVAPERGVCTDVVVRAYRKAFALDLQRLVHEDMKAGFAAYPRNWGMRAPDPNIDHRRVPNLIAFFKRKGTVLPVTADPADYLPGDLVTQMLPGNLPHILIVSSQVAAPTPGRRLAIHNIGQGAREEDTLFAFPQTGHFRFAPA
ncbi:DUF1287 domain-containing protein [Labrys neptuniae]|uniref:DUF1287 domain-containing protein n=1 Tax=Labrys neptuniae TaxID=376174 RepID=UPI0028900788|nr:DUF1287 domain-containing protein [Labrys neptuniae]MDT3375893.1 DUF1287 domain-containing protein [Labrys neptuniae]